MIADGHGVIVHQLHQVEGDRAVAASGEGAGEYVACIKQKGDLGCVALAPDEGRQLGNAANARHVVAPERFRWVIGALEIVREQQRDVPLLRAPYREAAEKAEYENGSSVHEVLLMQ